MDWVSVTIAVGFLLALALALYHYAKRRHAADLTAEEARVAEAIATGQPYRPKFDPSETDYEKVAQAAKWFAYVLAFVLALETFVFSSGVHLVWPWQTTTGRK